MDGRTEGGDADRSRMLMWQARVTSKLLSDSSGFGPRRVSRYVDLMLVFRECFDLRYFFSNIIYLFSPFPVVRAA